ncbi:hypothetical protein LTR66_004319 [Elasticomyces elasticus]|nr:hypothetical protein LTR66_004319 [Elasticomyces elasticus]
MTPHKRKRSASPPRRRSPPRAPRSSKAPNNAYTRNTFKSNRPTPRVSTSTTTRPTKSTATSTTTNGTTNATTNAATNTATNATSDKRAKTDVPEEEYDTEEEMKRKMGFVGFRSTKNTKVPGNDKNYAVRKDKKTTYRQYMNRTGGFNRPLSPTR